MIDTGIHSIVVSFVKVFNSGDIKRKVGMQASKSLFAMVDNERIFDVQRVEIVTEENPHVTISGKKYDSIPRADEIIPLEDFEKSLKKSEEAEDFGGQVGVRLSVAYPISELKKFLEEAEDEDYEDPNLFTWIEYCIDDGNEVLGEDRRDSPDLKPLLTIREI